MMKFDMRYYDEYKNEIARLIYLEEGFNVSKRYDILELFGKMYMEVVEFQAKANDEIDKLKDTDSNDLSEDYVLQLECEIDGLVKEIKKLKKEISNLENEIYEFKHCG